MTKTPKTGIIEKISKEIGLKGRVILYQVASEAISPELATKMIAHKGGAPSGDENPAKRPEVREKISCVMSQRATPEVRRRLSRIKTQQWADPNGPYAHRTISAEQRQALSEGMKRFWQEHPEHRLKVGRKKKLI